MLESTPLPGSAAVRAGAPEAGLPGVNAPSPGPSKGQPDPHTHHEHHFASSHVVRDLVIGLSDGLTVPFALAAGLSGAVGSSRLVLLAGLAEIAAGSIAMGLGGYLAARGDAEHYVAERAREVREVRERTRDEEEEIFEIFAQYHVPRESATPVLMRFELGLEEPASGGARRSALTIAGAYVGGGLLPLLPYMLIADSRRALAISCGVTLLALAIFGAAKGRLLGTGSLRSTVQTVLIGGSAAAAAYGLAKLLSAHPF